MPFLVGASVVPQSSLKAERKSLELKDFFKCMGATHDFKVLTYSCIHYEQSLFFLGTSSKMAETRKWPRAWLMARDGRGSFFLLRLPPSFLASRGFAAQRSRARALPLLNLKKKRYCSQSNSCNVEKRHLYVKDVRLVGPSARKGHFLLFL